MVSPWNITIPEFTMILGFLFYSIKSQVLYLSFSISHNLTSPAFLVTFASAFLTRHMSFIQKRFIYLSLLTYLSFSFSLIEFVCTVCLKLNGIWLRLNHIAFLDQVGFSCFYCYILKIFVFNLSLFSVGISRYITIILISYINLILLVSFCTTCSGFWTLPASRREKTLT